jgi:hypothetical protein
MAETFEQQINGELKSMDQRLQDLEGGMLSIDKKLTQVVDAILGNSLTKSGGVVNDIQQLQKQIIVLEAKALKQEEFKNRVFWTIGIVVSIGLLIQYLTTIYKAVKP